MKKPIKILSDWIQEEHKKGAPNPQQAVLATIDSSGVPHARVVAIREIQSSGIVFFTQKGTRKVEEMKENPRVAITFWFELYQREVIIEGQAYGLSDDDNKRYWQTYPREAQIRFHSYAPTSSQPIQDKRELENKKRSIEETFKDQEIPYTPLYCGFRVVPHKMIFYSYRTDTLSDVIEYVITENGNSINTLSP